MSNPAEPQGWWDAHGLPHAVDIVLSDRFVGGWRRSVAAGARGTVLELGFGSGSNLTHYPPSVDRVLAIDPADSAWRRAESAIAAFGRPVTRIGTDAAVIDLPDASVDTVIATWTLCSIPEVESALAHARRVLRPGGSFRLVEHALAPRSWLATTQRILQPVWGRVAGGCHVDRDIRSLVRAAGFDDSGLSEGDAFGVRTPWSWFVSGVARPRGRDG